MTKHHANRYEKRFKAAVEAEFGKGATIKTEGVKERFVDHPLPTDPQLPDSLIQYADERFNNLQKAREVWGLDIAKESGG